MREWEAWMSKLWGRSLEQKRHLELSISSPNFLFCAQKVVFNAYWIPSREDHGQAGQGMHLSTVCYHCLHVEFGYIKTVAVSPARRNRLNCNSFLYAMTPIEGKREFVLFNSSGLSNSPIFMAVCWVPRADTEGIPSWNRWGPST